MKTKDRYFVKPAASGTWMVGDRVSGRDVRSYPTRDEARAHCQDENMKLRYANQSLPKPPIQRPTPAANPALAHSVQPEPFKGTARTLSPGAQARAYYKVRTCERADDKLEELINAQSQKGYYPLFVTPISNTEGDYDENGRFCGDKVDLLWNVVFHCPPRVS